MKDDALLISVELRKSGRISGEMAGDFGTDRAVAESVLRLAFPHVQRVQWSKTATGWAFEGMMPLLQLPSPGEAAPAPAAAPAAAISAAASRPARRRKS